LGQTSRELTGNRDDRLSFLLAAVKTAAIITWTPIMTRVHERIARIVLHIFSDSLGREPRLVSCSQGEQDIEILYDDSL